MGKLIDDNSGDDLLLDFREVGDVEMRVDSANMSSHGISLWAKNRCPAIYIHVTVTPRCCARSLFAPIRCRVGQNK